MSDRQREINHKMTDTLIDRFQAFIRQHQLDQPDRPWLVAVSGGLDSVVLADLLHQIGWPFAVAHAHFGLRGADSDADEAFVGELAARYGVPYYVRRFDVAAHRRLHGGSVQMAARTLRYAWFEALRRAKGYDRIATGHHQQDALETFLLNLVRGTGLAGLGGLAPRHGHRVRPLLAFARTEIADYAAARGLTWREDASNQRDTYRRNYLRHHVVPHLQALNPQLLPRFADTAEQLRAAQRLLSRTSETLRQQAQTTVGTTTRFSIPVLRQQAEPAFWLAQWLRPYGFGYAQARQVVAAFDRPPGRQFFSATHCLVKDRTALVLTPRSEANPGTDSVPEQRIAAGQPGTAFADQRLWLDEVAVGTAVSDNAHTAFFDADALRFPLLLRPWRPGDRFRPLGMSGHKKVSDLLVERKVPLSLKAQAYVLLSGDDIVWVIGLRTSEVARITPQTRRMLRMRVVPSSSG